MDTKAKEWKLCSHDDDGMASRHQQARNANPFTAGAALLEKWAGVGILTPHPCRGVPLCGEIKGPRPRDTRPSQAGAIQ